VVGAVGAAAVAAVAHPVGVVAPRQQQTRLILIGIVWNRKYV
jgi:hypothetical protein